MINTQNYKNEVKKLWEEYKGYISKLKKDMKNIRNSLDYTEIAKDKKIEELRTQIRLFNDRQGKGLLEYLQEGIDYVNKKALSPMDTKKLLDITNLLKEAGKVLNDDEILSLTKEFHDNAIAVKTINSIVGKQVIQEPPTTIIIKNIEILKANIRQAISAAGNDDQGMMMPFQGWEITCQVVEISINNIAEKL